MTIHVATSALSLDHESQAFAQDVLAGLSRVPKQLSPKYFYDRAGSELFEQITQLPEYYPTRTELHILADHAEDIASLAPAGGALVEFGAGAATKAKLILATGRLKTYVPVDISGSFLQSQAQALRKDSPSLTVLPIVADFTKPFALPQEIATHAKVGFFPGSTIGNFDPDDARRFLETARYILGEGARLVIGVDLEKGEYVLIPAYDDAAGVTARFNLNLLARINRELGGHFDLAAFRHLARYNSDCHRIEMHLVSTRAQSVDLLGHCIAFRAGESIHTESSYKYSVPRFAKLAQSAGWTVDRTWTDDAKLFSVHVLAA